mmetsp:Transcript_30880/g.78070  ORF Transcript_30880/g.78070 Transcript_30880/m.78070 type:complete len:359 (+) Transcript_30880:111-1187(+)
MKGPFSLRRGAGGSSDAGAESSSSATGNYMDLNSIVPGAAASSSSSVPSRHSGPTKSLRGGPVKPPAPVADDDDDDGARNSVVSKSSFNRPSFGSTFSMAGAAAISLRKSMRRDTGEQERVEAARRATPVHSYTPEPEPEIGWTPRPPGSARPAGLAPRPAQPSIPARRTQPSTSTGSTARADEQERQSWNTSKAPSWMGRCKAPVGWTSSSPVQPRPPEETAPAAPVAPDDADDMRLSNFSVKSSQFNTASRSKSTPSRARRKQAASTAQSSTDEHGEAGVIKKTLRPGRRPAGRPLDYDREERDSQRSRATGTFTSHGTGTFDSRMTNESRGTFNFGDENPDDDDEALLADPFAAF